MNPAASCNPTDSASPGPSRADEAPVDPDAANVEMESDVTYGEHEEHAEGK